MERKKRIEVYTTEEIAKQFRIVSAQNSMSMSKFLEKLIQDEIKKFQEKTK